MSTRTPSPVEGFVVTHPSDASHYYHARLGTLYPSIGYNLLHRDQAVLWLKEAARHER